jgi:hypothetical protein
MSLLQTPRELRLVFVILVKRLEPFAAHPERATIYRAPLDAIAQAITLEKSIIAITGSVIGLRPVGTIKGGACLDRF